MSFICFIYICSIRLIHKDIIEDFLGMKKAQPQCNVVKREMSLLMVYLMRLFHPLIFCSSSFKEKERRLKIEKSTN